MLKRIAVSALLLCPLVSFTQNKIGIGTSTPTERLDVAGNIKADTIKSSIVKITGGTPGAGKVLTSDATGNASWQTTAGGGGTLTDAYNFGGAGAGRVINASTASLRVDGGYGLMVFGSLGTTFIENPGVGSRMFFSTGEGAFRAGYLNASNPNMWNKDSVGLISVAMGSNSNAYADYSVAIGNGVIARGNSAIAAGYLTKANGPASTALGDASVAEGAASVAAGKNNYAKAAGTVAMGDGNDALGSFSVALGKDNISTGEAAFTAGSQNRVGAAYAAAIGQGLISNGYGGLTVGRYNDTLYAAQTGITPSSTLFTVGNGFNAGGGRSTAFTVWNSGWTGVNTGVPNSTLSVNGSISLTPVAINTALSIGLDANSSVYFLNGSGSFAPPAANTCAGRIYILVNQTAAVKNFNGSSYLNFSGTAVTSIPANSGIKIISDGTNWRLIP
jgi:hypothetical protein